jgi:uncharacterized membrane protein YhaH (DUF805 family)
MIVISPMAIHKKQLLDIGESGVWCFFPSFLFLKAYYECKYKQILFFLGVLIDVGILLYFHIACAYLK